MFYGIEIVTAVLWGGLMLIFVSIVRPGQSFLDALAELLPAKIRLSFASLFVCLLFVFFVTIIPEHFGRGSADYSLGAWFLNWGAVLYGGTYFVLLTSVSEALLSIALPFISLSLVLLLPDLVTIKHSRGKLLTTK